MGSNPWLQTSSLGTCLRPNRRNLLLGTTPGGYRFRVRVEQPFRGFLLAAFLGVGLGLLRGVALAEDIRFPADSGVVDVTKSPYFAHGDGKADDTESLQQALLDNGNANRIIYLPNGVYLVSAPLLWPGGTNEESRQRSTILQGQSRDGTVIRLMDYAAGFGPGGRGHPLLWMGTDPATHPRNAVRNLSIETGVGNPSASGISVMANHQGGIRDVTVRAGKKGEGIVGFDLSHSETIGPCFLKNVRAEGFEFGIRAENAVNSFTLENVELVGQGTAGIRNSGQTLNIRRLRSTNAVPAIQNTDPTGSVTLIDAVLQGLPSRRAFPAIVNRGSLYVRSLMAPGHTNAIESRIETSITVTAPYVEEFLSHDRMAMFMAMPSSLDLPIEETPELPWDPPAQWAGPVTQGGKSGDFADDSVAIQRAIDSGATTVYLPNGLWRVEKTIEIRGPVRRIIGCEARIVNGGLGSKPVFRVVDGDSPVVVIERIEIEAPKGPLVQNDSGRTLVLSSCHNAGFILNGKGSLFLEDISGALPASINGQKVWARQWNIEYEGPKIMNDGGTLWLFGFKTERPGTLITTSSGGRTELLGSLAVSNGAFKSSPMFVIRDASVSLVAGEVAFQGNPYNVVVRETRAGVTKILERGSGVDLGMQIRSGGVGLVLYSGHDGANSIPPPRPRRKLDDKIPLKP